MKKLFYTLSMALLMVGCSEEDFKDWSVPQGFEPEAETETKTVNTSATAGEAIDFATVTEDSIKLFSVSVNTNAEILEQTAYVLVFNADTTKSQKVNATMEGKVATADIRKAVEKLYGKKAIEREVFAKVFVTNTLNNGYTVISESPINFKATPVAPAYENYIWQAGNSNGWGTPADGLYGANDEGYNEDGKYVGFMYLNGDFKFRSNETTWDEPDWGKGEENGTLEVKGGNLNAEEGYYKVEVDLSEMTYVLTPITTIGIVGPAQAGGWDADTDLSWNSETKAWEGTIALTAGEFKFRANDGWDINWGGTTDALKQGGDNLKIEEDGTYFIQLFAWCDTKAYCVITKQ